MRSEMRMLLLLLAFVSPAFAGTPIPAQEQALCSLYTNYIKARDDDNARLASENPIARAREPKGPNQELIYELKLAKLMGLTAGAFQDWHGSVIAYQAGQLLTADIRLSCKDSQFTLHMHPFSVYGSPPSTVGLTASFGSVPIDSSLATEFSKIPGFDHVPFEVVFSGKFALTHVFAKTFNFPLPDAYLGNGYDFGVTDFLVDVTSIKAPPA